VGHLAQYTRMKKALSKIFGVAYKLIPEVDAVYRGPSSTKWPNGMGLFCARLGRIVFCKDLMHAHSPGSFCSSPHLSAVEGPVRCHKQHCDRIFSSRALSLGVRRNGYGTNLPATSTPRPAPRATRPAGPAPSFLHRAGVLLLVDELKTRPDGSGRDVPPAEEVTNRRGLGRDGGRDARGPLASASWATSARSAQIHHSSQSCAARHGKGPRQPPGQGPHHPRHTIHTHRPQRDIPTHHKRDTSREHQERTSTRPHEHTKHTHRHMPEPAYTAHTTRHPHDPGGTNPRTDARTGKYSNNKASSRSHLVSYLLKALDPSATPWNVAGQIERPGGATVSPKEVRTPAAEAGAGDERLAHDAESTVRCSRRIAAIQKRARPEREEESKPQNFTHHTPPQIRR